MATDWKALVARQIMDELTVVSMPTVGNIELILRTNAPSNEPLLQCIDCRNTESPAGAVARRFNYGRCLHCGGFFKVVRA